MGLRQAHPRQPGQTRRPSVLRQVRRDSGFPGQVGIVVGNGKMVEAYATGFPIRVSTYGKPSSPLSRDS